MIHFFAKTFGEYPFIKEKYGVAEFLWQFGAMESQTLTGVGSNFVGGKMFFNDMFVHELAHHWWGDAVGPKTWKDVWLNEGFATYCEALYSEYNAGYKALQANMMSKFQEFNGTLYNPKGDLFGQIVYDKGAWVLNMLRWQVGDSTFFKILRNYYETYKYKNASTEDFKSICEKVSGQNLNNFFDQWVYTGKGIIDANYFWSSEKDGDSYNIKLHINQFQKDYEDYKFPLEVVFTFQDKTKQTKIFEINEREQEIDIKVNKEPAEINLDPNNHLLAIFKNVQKSN